MPSTNNNTNWKKRSGSVYQQELSLDKYDDPDNSIDKRKGTVINPPPIPNNPAKKPTGKAVAIIKSIYKEYWFDKIELSRLSYSCINIIIFNFIH